MSSHLVITGNDGVRLREKKGMGVPARIYLQAPLAHRRLQWEAIDGDQEALAGWPGPGPLGLLPLMVVVVVVLVVLMMIRLVAVGAEPRCIHLTATFAD